MRQFVSITAGPQGFPISQVECPAGLCSPETRRGRPEAATIICSVSTTVTTTKTSADEQLIVTHCDWGITATADAVVDSAMSGIVIVVVDSVMTLLVWSDRQLA